MRELGVIVQPTGDRQNVLKMKPPMCITREVGRLLRRPARPGADHRLVALQLPREPGPLRSDEGSVDASAVPGNVDRVVATQFEHACGPAWPARPSDRSRSDRRLNGLLDQIAAEHDRRPSGVRWRDETIRSWSVCPAAGMLDADAAAIQVDAGAPGQPVRGRAARAAASTSAGSAP